MFALCSNITIGRFINVKPHEVRISKSIYEYVDKAVIRLPITARLVRAGQIITQSAETAKQFSEGEKVTISLGYNNTLTPEFVGFVSRINFTSPLEIECEGYSYQLRTRTYKRTFVRAQLLDILKYLVAGTDIVLDEKNIPSFIIDKLVLQDHSGTEVLEAIEKLTHQTVRAYFQGNVLYMGLILLNVQSNTTAKPDVGYRIGWNVINAGTLKLRQAKNQLVTVKFLGVAKTGDITQAEEGYILSPQKKTVRTVGTSGTEGETKVVKTHAVNDQSALARMAKEMHSSLSYNGYEGKITAYLVPYCKPSDRALIIDEKYPERGGIYLVESTEVSYGTGGARRVVGLGIKL